MGTKSQVDLVVGIDFGMTYTGRQTAAPEGGVFNKNSGVAYSNLKMPQPRPVQTWPGKTGEICNKAPTTLLYSAAAALPQNRRVKQWGFLCQHDDGKKEWFKRFLDPEKLKKLKVIDDDLPELSDVRKWYKDYMTCLYTHLSDKIQTWTGRWEAKRVEFVFSLPSTFITPQLSEDLRSLLVQAGFESGGVGHSFSIGLTEPEAAAVYTVKESAVDIQIGEVLLVCDAGGGTTDFALLESVGTEDGLPELRELIVVEGQDIGSTNIDVAFEHMVEGRLSKIQPKLDDRTAWTMMHQADYLGWKCAFGQEDNKDLDTFAVAVPKVSSNYNHKGAAIKKGKMHFSQ